MIGGYDYMGYFTGRNNYLDMRELTTSFESVTSDQAPYFTVTEFTGFKYDSDKKKISGVSNFCTDDS